MTNQLNQVISFIKANKNDTNREGMRRFGIEVENAYGVNIPTLRLYAKHYKKNHELALALWETEIHEARLLASMIDNPIEVTKSQMNDWAHGFNSWDICDQVCSNLFGKTKFAYSCIPQWLESDREFVKRAAFVMMAVLAVHDKKAGDDVFVGFLNEIKQSYDTRNFVFKAMNWALRQIGKRNINLREKALQTAQEIFNKGTKTDKWVASGAIRELNDLKILKRLQQKQNAKK